MVFSTFVLYIIVYTFFCEFEKLILSVFYRFGRLGIAEVRHSFGRGKRIFRHRPGKRGYQNDSRVGSRIVRIGSTERQSLLGDEQILRSAHSSECSTHIINIHI